MTDGRGRDSHRDNPPSGDRPPRKDAAPYGDKPARGNKPSYGDRPPRGSKPSYGDRPPRGSKPSYGDRPPRGSKPSYGDRPPRKDGAPHGDRPPRGSKPSYGDRPPRGDKPREHPNAPMNLAPRRVALETLLDVSRSDAYASLALDKRLARAAFSARDRAFATQLVYGTLENRITLDWRIDRFLEQDKQVDPTVREILRMGAYQLFCLDRVPDMAAVDESVRLTRAMGLEALTGLVNAVLRRMIREGDDVPWPTRQDGAARYLSVRCSVGEELAQMLLDAYGEQGALEIAQYRPSERPTVIRVNALRCDEARLCRLLQDEGLTFAPGLLPGTFRIDRAGDLTRLRAFQNGLFTIQGEGSVLAARALRAAPGQSVLDACAAPGGKSAVLSEMMNDTGRVYAWDTHAHRVELIRATARRLGLDNIRPALRDASVPRPEMDATMDGVLVDAPCSGTGVMTEKPDVKYRVTQEGVEHLIQTQAAILDAVAPMVRPGGALVYSTCSVLPQENEAQVRAFLTRHAGYRPEPMGEELPEALRAHEGELGIQLFAHRDGTEGFYICRLRRVAP